MHDLIGDGRKEERQEHDEQDGPVGGPEKSDLLRNPIIAKVCDTVNG